jgi:UrcA family protein
MSFFPADLGALARCRCVQLFGVLSAVPRKGNSVMRRVALAVFTAALIATPALAVETEAVVLRVKVQDLDLESASGAKIALERINRAATRACTFSNPNSRVRLIDSACVNQVTGIAVANLKAPQVLALYQAKKPQTRQG